MVSPSSHPSAVPDGELNVTTAIRYGSSSSLPAYHCTNIIVGVCKREKVCVVHTPNTVSPVSIFDQRSLAKHASKDIDLPHATTPNVHCSR